MRKHPFPNTLPTSSGRHVLYDVLYAAASGGGHGGLLFMLASWSVYILNLNFKLICSRWQLLPLFLLCGSPSLIVKMVNLGWNANVRCFQIIKEGINNKTLQHNSDFKGSTLAEKDSIVMPGLKLKGN